MDSIFALHLPPPLSCLASVSLYRFVMVHPMDLIPFLDIPPASSPSLSGRIVCQYQMCGVPFIQQHHTPCHILCSSPQSVLPGLPLNYLWQSSFYEFSASYCLHFKFLKVVRFLLLCGVRPGNISRTAYVLIVSERLPESATTCPGHKLCQFSFW